MWDAYLLKKTVDMTPGGGSVKRPTQSPGQPLEVDLIELEMVRTTVVHDKLRSGLAREKKLDLRTPRHVFVI